MNRKMTRVLIFILLLSTFVAAFCLLTGCETDPNGEGGASNNGGDKVAVSKVYVKETEKPQLTFVQGNEPDFSAGKLSVERENGSLETVALNDAGVTVTGYDKNTLGEQTVTFSYGGKATTLKVTVVRRMVFKGLTAKYFVGDAFDKSAGTVRVTSDDGKTVNVNMSDDSITVEGFNAATAGAQSVTVRYTASGASYTDTVNVQVYEVGNVKFTAPGKLTYKSHDTEMKISDGYFTVTAKDDATLSKHVPLTKEMVVEGFDPTEVTREHIDTALSQEIKVEYLGNAFTFSITITYSGVSIMQDAIDELKDMVWDGTTPEYTTAQGEIALEAIGYYLEMSAADRELIDATQAMQVVKLAAVYGSESYVNLLGEFSDAFAIDVEQGALAITGKTYEGVNTAAIRLNDPSDEFMVLGSLLNDLVTEFGEQTFDGTNKIKNSVFVLNDNVVVILREIFSHMAKLHNDMAAIPEDWTVQDLEDFAGQIAAAVRHMDAATFGQYTSYVMLCDQVSSWRERDDYLEIIYTYYINYKDQNSFATDLWQRQVPLPGDIQQLYSLIANGVAMINEFAAGGAIAWKDTTSFLFLYDQTIELSNKIANGEDGLYKDIYYFVNFPQLISQYLSGTYRTFCNSLYGDAEFTNLYGCYLTILKHMVADGENYDVNNYLQERQDLIDLFVSMSPAKQKAFLGAVNYLYHVENINDFMLLDFSEGESRSYFIHLMFEYLLQQGLSKELVTTTVNDLFLAIEYYLNTDRYGTALDSFMQKMEAVQNAYQNDLSEDEQKLFDKLLGKAYSRYSSIYEFEKKKAAEQEIELGDTAALLEELKATFAQMQGILELINDESTDRQTKDRAMVLLFTAYEKCASLAAQITATTDYDVLGTYYNVKYQITENVSGTMDDALVYYRSYFINYLLSASYGTMDEKGNVTYYSTWNLYVSSSNISAFMAEISDMMYAIFNGETVTADVIEKAKIALATLTESELALFRVMAGAENYVDFMGYVLSGDMAAILEKMQVMVEKHLEFSFAEKGEQEAALAAFKAAVEDAEELVESLKENEEYKTYIKPMYDQFVAVLNAAENNGNTEQEVA